MRALRLWLPTLVALNCATALAWPIADPALARSPLSWKIEHVDGNPSHAQELALHGLGISCAQQGYFCAAVDNLGRVLWSSNVTAAKSRWRLKSVDYNPSFGSTGIDSVSCPSSSLCVAVDNDGNVLRSLNPATNSPTWGLQHVDRSYNVIYGVSCVETLLCVAVDNQGDVLSSTDLQAPNPSWSFEDVDQANLIAGVSCPSTSLCVAVDSEGNMLISSDPTAPTPAWSITLADNRAGFASISCPSISLCVAGDTNGDVAVSTDPSSSAPTWKLLNIDGTSRQRFGLKNLTVACAPLGAICVAGDFAGRMMVSTNPAAATPHWSVTTVDRRGGSTRSITGLSCTSASLCVAGDSAGNVLIGRPSSRANARRTAPRR